MRNLQIKMMSPGKFLIIFFLSFVVVHVSSKSRTNPRQRQENGDLTNRFSELENKVNRLEAENSKLNKSFELSNENTIVVALNATITIPKSILITHPEWLKQLEALGKGFQILQGQTNEMSAPPAKPKPKNCAEAAGGRQGIVEIEIPGSDLGPFPVYCTSDNWMVILRRIDTVDFNQKWHEYKKGFGNLNGNFILGLEKIHQITNSQCHMLRINLRLTDTWTHALYDQFQIDDEAHEYSLSILGKHSGLAKDGLSRNMGMKFSTADRDNGESARNCASRYSGGWWFSHDCGRSNLAGNYKPRGVNYCNGITWDSRCMRDATMMIKPC